MELRKLKVEMYKKKITQTDLAQALGISYKSVNDKLNGKKEFKDSEKIQIMQILGISVEQIAEFFLPSIVR